MTRKEAKKSMAKGGQAMYHTTGTRTQEVSHHESEVIN